MFTNQLRRIISTTMLTSLVFTSSISTAISANSSTEETLTTEYPIYNKVYVDFKATSTPGVPEEDIEITKVSYTRYAKTTLYVRSQPDKKSESLGKLSINDKVKVIGELEDNKFVQIKYNDGKAFVHSDYLSEEKVAETKTLTSNWKGPKLTKRAGRITGPSGQETYYNLNMSGVVKIMRRLGFSAKEYPYWVREDGVKMLGNYVMVAANFNIRPRGSVVETSLGYGLVTDTGGFAKSNPTQLDIATSW